MQTFLTVAVLVSCFSFAASISSPLEGVTAAKYNGSLATCGSTHCGNGYEAAGSKCALEFPGSRVCTADDLAIVAQSETLFVILGQGDVRYIDTSYAQVYNRDTGNYVPLNDCNGYTTASNEQYSRCLREIFGGPVLPSLCPCSEQVSFICCS